MEEKKGEKGAALHHGLQHSLNIIIKAASTGNVIIQKCEMCV